MFMTEGNMIEQQPSKRLGKKRKTIE